MPKKDWSEEEKKAFGEKMRLARLEKIEQEKKDYQDNLNVEAEKETLPEAPESSDEITISKSEFTDLLKTVAELKSQLQTPNQFTPQAVVTPKGIIGVTEKYSVSKYPDPTPRLKKEPRLAPFAFEYNYDLVWRQEVSQYPTKEGLTLKEPRFEIDLLGIRLDDDGNQTNERWIVRRLVFHEDPEAALEIARTNGLEVSTENEMEFLNEMRYLRAKDWLLEVFYPPTTQQVKKKREEVIGNTVVQVFEVTSDKEENIKI